MMGGDSVSWGVAELCGQRGKQRWIMPILFKVTSEVLFASVSVGNDSDSIMIFCLKSRTVLTNQVCFFMTCAHYRMAEAVEHIISVLLRINF